MRVDTAEQQNRVIVNLAGELDAAAAPEVRTVLIDAVNRSAHVEVDLGDVAFVDSSGLDALVVALKQARARSGTFQLRNVDPRVGQVLRVTGLDRIFGTAPSQ